MYLFSFCASFTHDVVILWTSHPFAYWPGMLFIHKCGLVQKCQPSRSYSCAWCGCVSVIIAMAVKEGGTGGG